MFKRLIAAFLVLVAASATSATVTVSVDLCDATDGISLPPNNLVPGGIAMVDIFANVNLSMAHWTASGVRVQTAPGVTLRYAIDPNTHNPVPVNPGTANRFVTFFSVPRGRDASGRYTNGAAAAAGRYSPTGPIPEYFDTRVNVAYFSSPPPTNGPSSGYLFRVAINLPASLPPEGHAVVTVGATVPAGNIPLAISVGGEPGDFGSVAATFDMPQVTGIDWNISWTPEPTALGLLLMAGFAALRRR